MRRYLATSVLAAAMLGMQPAFPSNVPRLPKSPYERDATPRQKRVRARLKAERTRRHLAGFAHNDRKRQKQRELHAEFQAMVNLLSNYERKKWSGAGWPGLREKDASKVRPYVRRFEHRLLAPITKGAA